MSDIDTSVIIENLTELLQNSVNMTSVFYDIFLNPTPMDVELKQYNSEGELITVTIPNRAKDRQISLEGTGSPEGIVTANPGASYIDSENGTVYFKVSGSGNTGWQIVLTQQGVDTSIAPYLSYFITEDSLARYLENSDYVTTTALDNALSAYKPTIPMSTLITSGDITLVDNSGYAITATGNIDFILPYVTDLTILHKIFIQLNMLDVYSITLGTDSYFDRLALDFSSAGRYNIMYEYDNTQGTGTVGWVVGAMTKGTV